MPRLSPKLGALGLCALAWLGLAGSALSDPPAATLRDGALQAIVYLPSADAGFYRGSRFNWSGMMPSLQAGDHGYFTAWSSATSPAVNQAAGPADEFDPQDMAPSGPPGYASAKPGEVFLKIGVGWLRKSSNAPYVGFQPYEIVDSGKWTVFSSVTEATFQQELPVHDGLGYSYQKHISLHSADHSLVITQTLTNIGTKELKTVNYCHNFLSIDHAASRAVYRYSLDPSLQPVALSKDDFHEQGRFGFLDPVGDRAVAFLPERGQGKTLSALVENQTSGASVRITCPSDPVKFQMYATGAIVCPEFFVAITLAPGQQATWQWTYTFSP